MRTLLIDDQKQARDKTRMMLELYAPTIEIVGEADGVRAGLDCIQELQPELVFLDVEMADGTGFDLLSLCKDPDFKVIFITGHDAFAIKAFKFSAIDYLLKPVDLDDLLKAIGKVEKQYEKFDNSLSISTLIHNKQVEAENKKIVIADSETIYLLGKNEIIRCQSEGNYTRFYLTDERTMLVSKTLKTYVDLLDGDRFFRPHRSHLINLSHFDKYEKKDGGIIYMKDGSTLPIAIRRKDFLMEALKKQ